MGTPDVEWGKLLAGQRQSVIDVLEVERQHLLDDLKLDKMRGAPAGDAATTSRLAALSAAVALLEDAR